MSLWNEASAIILPGCGEAMGGRHSFRRRFRRTRPSKVAFDPSIWPFSSPSRQTPPVVTTHSPRSVLSWGLSSSQPVDQAQDLLEQFSRRRDLGHLEDGVAGVAHDLGTDLHQRLPQAGQRPLRDCLRQRQRPHEVGEIVGQCVQLETHRIGGERAA
jgi:hypothetical protein